jgi:anti-sigma regulatory factor (Ser/Thr protein kinase)
MSLSDLTSVASVLDREYVIASDKAQVSTFLEGFIVELESLGVIKKDAFRVRLALDEALVNAVKHGNLEDSEAKEVEPTPEMLARKVRLQVDIDDVEPQEITAMRPDGELEQKKIDAVLSARIRDEGPGFDPKDVPVCTAEEALTKESGRGLFLMKCYMDEVGVQRMPVGMLVQLNLGFLRQRIQDVMVLKGSDADMAGIPDSAGETEKTSPQVEGPDDSAKL